jgi:hypothetical protein
MIARRPSGVLAAVTKSLSRTSFGSSSVSSVPRPAVTSSLPVSGTSRHHGSVENRLRNRPIWVSARVDRRCSHPSWNSQSSLPTNSPAPPEVSDQSTCRRRVSSVVGGVSGWLFSPS